MKTLLERLSARPRLVFVNLVNELMATKPSDDYARRMAVVTPRELCTCFPGDVLVVPAPMSDAFRDYCMEVVGLERDSVTILATSDLHVPPLAAAFATRSQLDVLESALRGESYALDPFAMDLPTLDLATVLGTPILNYDSVPPASVMALYYWLNTKMGFKQLARELGIPVVDGRYCTSPESVAAAISSNGHAQQGVKIKPNRGSNGYGHLDLRASSALPGELQAKLEPTPSGYILEPLMPFVDSPSVELHVSPAGPLITYTCSMRVPGGAFTGMITPPAAEDSAMRAQLERHAASFGEYLHRSGVYGFCDVDAGITGDGRVWFTETNLRRTGGTYLDVLMRRLVGDEYESTHTWLAESRPLRDSAPFADVLAKLQDSGLAWDAARKHGIILTSDTLRWDNRIRYLCIGRSGSDVLEQETSLRRLFEIADA